jgi:hypothetical protein
MRSLHYQDESRLEYGRLLWKKPATRLRLLAHWLDARHPYKERFEKTWRPMVERVLSSPAADDARLDAELRTHNLSLRVVTKEIPPVFGSFY